jgi:hypothetical protein
MRNTECRPHCVQPICTGMLLQAQPRKPAIVQAGSDDEEDELYEDLPAAQQHAAGDQAADVPSS